MGRKIVEVPQFCKEMVMWLLVSDERSSRGAAQDL